MKHFRNAKDIVRDPVISSLVGSDLVLAEAVADLHDPPCGESGVLVQLIDLIMEELAAALPKDDSHPSNRATHLEATVDALNRYQFEVHSTTEAHT